MPFINSLMMANSSVYTIFILSLVITLGFSLGNLRVFGVKLGVVGVFFAGLLFGHLHWSVDIHLLEFIREFGLVIFVYTIGLHVGPGFVVSLKKQGLKLNLLASAVVFFGVLIAVLFIRTHIVSVPEGVGLLSGATTNTPSLGAAQEAFKIQSTGEANSQETSSLAYAITYPFGGLGIILFRLS